MKLDPTELGVAERYKLLIGCIVPRPIALVSTISPGGVPNLAPFSFFNGVGSDPMTVVVCPGNRPDGGDKDTLRNLLPGAEGGTGVFVVNAASTAYEREVAAAGHPLPYEESEFDLVGLTPAPSAVVAAPRVAEARFAFECRTIQVVRTAPGRPGAGNVVVGEVVAIHLDDDLVDERMRVDPDRLAALGRMGGRGYVRARVDLELPPDRRALDRG